MSEIKAVISDWDGTLIDSVSSGMIESINLAHKLGIKNVPDQKFLKKYWGLKFQEIIEEISKEYFWTEEEKQEFLKQSLLIHEDHKLFYGISDCIFELRKKSIECLVISSREKESLLNSFCNVGLKKEDFSLIQGLEDCEFPKPDKRVFSPALSLLAKKKIYKENVCYIGDTKYDFFSARDAGIKFFAVETGFMERDDWLKLGVLKEDVFMYAVSVLRHILEN